MSKIEESVIVKIKERAKTGKKNTARLWRGTT